MYNWKVVTDTDDDDNDDYSEKADANGIVTENIHAAAEKSGSIPVDVAEGCSFVLRSKVARGRKEKCDTKSLHLFGVRIRQRIIDQNISNFRKSQMHVG